MHLTKWTTTISLALLTCLTGACSQGPAYRLSILSEPAGATVTVKDVASGRVLRTRAAPLSMTLSFAQDATQYLVTADPPDSAVETHRTRTLYLDRAGVEALPRSGTSRRDTRTRDLVLLLPEREYVELPQQFLVFHSGKGWVAIATRRRSFKSVLEADGSAPERIAALDEGAGFAGISLSPDGDRLAYGVFASELFEPTLDQRDRRRRDAAPDLLDAHLRRVTEGNIRTVRITGGGRESITADPHLDFHPSFSAGGDWIVYCSTRERNDRSDVFRRRAAVRGGLQKITADLRDRSAAWAAAGGAERIAFTSLTPGLASLAHAEITTLDGPTGYRTLVAKGAHPSVSADGARIAYISDGNLWVADAEGAGAMQLTFDAAEIRSDYAASLTNAADVERHRLFEDRFVLLPYATPAWTPDGQWILVAGMRNRGPEGRPNADIMAIRADGSGREVVITTNPSVDEWPMASADGQWIYFVSNRGQQIAVWRVETPAALKSPR